MHTIPSKMPTGVTAVLPDYAELQTFSHFTFLRGASAPEQLVQRAFSLGYKAIAITDECSLAGVVKAHIAAKELDIALVIGSQLTVTPEDGSSSFNLIILATNKNGYGNLSELITVGRMRGEKGSYLIQPRDIAMPVGAQWQQTLLDGVNQANLCASLPGPCNLSAHPQRNQTPCTKRKNGA